MRNSLLLAALFTSVALAQAPGTPAPAEGAIKGGTIRPGERGGIPEAAPDAPGLPPAADERARARMRCNELDGTLREQCLHELEGSAGAGGTRAPDLPVGRDPRLEPPPQNPQ